MFIEPLNWLGEKNGDADAINNLLRQFNPSVPECTRVQLTFWLRRMNEGGGVAVIRENDGKIVAMGTWMVIQTLMRTESFARDVIVDRYHPEWLRFLREIVQYLINRAKEAGAEHMDTWNISQPGHNIFRDLGFLEVDTRFLRKVF